MRYEFRQREFWERCLLGIFSNYPEIINKLNFRSEYFKFEVHKKFYDYLKEFKEMNIEKMLVKMSMNEAEYCINDIYTENVYDLSRDSMALGFANLILEDYKAEEISKIEDERKLDIINSDKYYFELTKLVNLSVEPKIDVLTDIIIDDFVSDENEGIKIRGFEYLARYLKLILTDVVTVAAVSGFGKSAFLLNLYQSLSQDESTLCKCQYFNIEVAPKNMIKRLLAITSDRRVDEFNKSNLSSPFYWQAKEKILNDSYIHSGSITIEELKAKVLNNVDSEKINIVFVDHIGLLDVADKNYNRTEYDRITYCMKELRKMALDNNLIVFIASQFDRSSVKEKKLTMHSLKSSGEIENSSTHVLLLNESETRVSQSKADYEEVIIDIVKNRNGPIAKLDYYTFIKTKQIFKECGR